MNKADIVDRVARGTGLTKLETEAVVDGFLTTLRGALEAGERVELRGFGVFDVRPRAARALRTPGSDEVVEVPAHHAPVFRPARELKRRVAEAHAPDA